MTDEQYTAHVLQGVEPGLDLRERRLLAGFGLAGETGEVTEPVKKWAWHHKPEPDREYMKKELGDVLWYLTLMASTFGLTLTEIMEANVAKLIARYPERHQTPPVQLELSWRPGPEYNAAREEKEQADAYYGPWTGGSR